MPEASLEATPQEMDVLGDALAAYSLVMEARWATPEQSRALEGVVLDMLGDPDESLHPSGYMSARWYAEQWLGFCD